jgi:septal ring factor EnvC (AmiA/AmiB activator)
MNRLRRLSARLPAPLAALGIALPLASLSAVAPAQNAAPEKPGTAQNSGAAQDAIEQELLKTRAEELEKARAERLRASEAEKKLLLEIEAIGADRRKLNALLIAAAAKTREAEERLAQIETRLAPLEEHESALRDSLHERRGEIAEILAAMQRAGLRPPPALLVSPEDAMKSVRSAIALGAMVPQMRERAEKLAKELSMLAQLRRGIDQERAKLAAELEKFATDRQRVARLVEERQKAQTDAETSLANERGIAADMARNVDNLTDLVARLEQGVASVQRAARAALQTTEDHAKENQKGARRPDFDAFKDPGRLTPAIAFANARGLLPMPVNGVKIRNFGAPDRAGGHERGISIATRAGAQITSPSDGWVVYAGAFRSYGQVLILNAGDGYHIVLAGMDRISVNIGQFVLTGEPVASMGSGATQVAATGSIGTRQPVLYIEFRKDGTPVDPGPWWAKGESEKVRG